MEKPELIQWIKTGLQELGYVQNIIPNGDSINFEINSQDKEKINQDYLIFAKDVRKISNESYSLGYTVKDSLNPESKKRMFLLETIAKKP